MTFHPYPTRDQFMQAALYLIPVLRGKTPDDKAAAVNAAWVIVGFAGSVYSPVEGVVSVRSTNAGEVADMLERLCADHPEKFQVKAAGVPWQVVLPFLQGLIQEWLKGKFGVRSEDGDVEALCRKREVEEQPVEAE